LKATGYAALATVGRGIELAEVQSQRWVQQEAVRTAGGVPKLVKMMAAASFKERCASANALSNASDHNEANCDAIVDRGGLAILHTLLVHEPPANANAEETDEDKELKFLNSIFGSRSRFGRERQSRKTSEEGGLISEA
jgi:hypothetical protein